MAAITIDMCRNKTDQLIDSIEKTASLISLPGHVFLSYCHTFKLLYYSKKMIDYYKTEVFPCKETCSIPKQCILTLCERSTKIRDQLFEIHKKTQTTPFLKPQVLIFKHLLDEWDDLVDDCTITTDAEVNNLLAQIADAA